MSGKGITELECDEANWKNRSPMAGFISYTKSLSCMYILLYL